MQLRTPRPASPVVIAVFLACGTAVVGVPAVAAAEPTVESPPADTRWKTRRRDLAIGVGVAAAVSVAGMITTFVPLARCNRGIACSGEEYPREALIAGPIVLGLGALATTGVASALVHHNEWHRPGTKPGDLRRARAAQRRLDAAIGLGVSLGGVAIGSVAIGLLAASSPNCYQGCPGAEVGAGVGFALIFAGLVGLSVSATSYALHRRHRHDHEGLRVRLQPTASGLRLSF